MYTEGSETFLLQLCHRFVDVGFSPKLRGKNVNKYCWLEYRNDAECNRCESVKRLHCLETKLTNYGEKAICIHKTLK